VLPSYPLDLWKVSHISTLDVEQRNLIPYIVVIVSPLNALDQIDVRNIRMSLDKRIAFSK